MFPAQRPQLLGPRAGEQRDHDVGVQPIGHGLRQHVVGLLRAKRLRSAPRLPGGHIGQMRAQAPISAGRI
jgi:hypothetical protein